MQQIVLNKSKNKTIVFIHGFYANAGYWLPYLPFFKPYRIVLLDINYLDLLASDNRISAARELFKEFKLKDGVYATISHSLGTVISGFMNLEAMGRRFEICPVGFSNRSDTSGFIHDIQERVNEPGSQINSNLLLVDRLINECKDYAVKNSIRYIPDSDQYFTYHKRFSEDITFQGDHFDITEAIVDITGRLE
jgi:hypothetical protein